MRLRFAKRRHPNSSCKGYETGQRIFTTPETGSMNEFDPALNLFATKVGNKATAATNWREFRIRSCTAATLAPRLKMNLTFACGHRL
jgi:hypothetical protein